MQQQQFQRNVDFYNIAIGTVKKFLHKFIDKEKYVFRYENLQFYLRLGLKVHRVLEFNQSQLLNPYIEFNIQKRIEAGKMNKKIGKHIKN